MKRYLLFYGDDYEPGGGWRDFIGSFETVEQARIASTEGKQASYFDWFQIVDIEKGEVVEEGKY